MKLENTGRKLALVIAFTVLSVSIFAFLVSKSGVKPPWSHPYQATVILPDAYRLVPDADVREAGIRVGKVSKVDYQLTPKGVESRVVFAMDSGYKLYRDAHVLLRFKSLANEDYIDLAPGTTRAGLLPSGSTLPANSHGEAVQLDQILGTFDTATRQRVQEDLDAVGAGLDGHGGDLNRMIGAAPPVSEQGKQVLGVVDAQRRQVADVIANTSSVLQAFGDRTQAVRNLAHQARVAADAASSRDTEIASALQALPGTLGQARRTVAHLGAFSSRATPVVADLTSVTLQVTPLLRDLKPAAASARPLVRELPTALRQARPLLAQLTPFANHLTPAVTALDAVLRQANPLLTYLAPYHRELGVFFADNGSALGAVDAAGHKGRVFGLLSPNSFTGLSESQKKDLQILIDAGTLGQASAEDVNPIPHPGTVGHPQPFDGHYPRLSEHPPYTGR